MHFVLCSIRPRSGVNTHSTVIIVFAIEASSIGHDVESFALFPVVNKGPVVNVTAGVEKLSPPIAHVILKLSDIGIAIGVITMDVALSLPILKSSIANTNVTLLDPVQWVGRQIARRQFDIFLF